MNDAIALEVQDLGLVPYAEALALQSDLVGRRRAGDIPDQLLLLQHPHVITLGTASSRAHIVADQSRLQELGIDLVDVGRGGDVTYHGQGPVSYKHLRANETGRNRVRRVVDEKK